MKASAEAKEGRQGIMNWRKQIRTQKIGWEADGTKLPSKDTSSFGVGVQDAKKQYEYIVVVLLVYGCAIIVMLNIVLR